MDIERNLEDQNRINILCYSFGSTSENFFDEVVTLLNKSVTRIHLSPSQQNELKEKGRSAMPQKDWKADWIQCKYFVKNPVIDWPECQIFYKCHVAIVIVDMDVVDVEKIGEDLSKLKKTMSTDQIVPYRIFIFNGNQEEHMKYFSEEKNINFVPKAIREDDRIESLQEEVATVIVTTAIHFFSEMNRIKVDSHTVPLFNAKEEIIKDSAKVKKRKQGRSTKLCGDMSLMLGGYKDAGAYYNLSYENLKDNEDHLWVGKTREGQAASILCEYWFLNKEDQLNNRVLAKVIEEITKKMESASLYFRRAKVVKSADFDKECFFKLLKVLKNLGAKNNFSDFVKFYIDNYGKGAGNLEEHYKMMLKLASFFYEMKMYRKAGLFLKMVADQILQDNFNQDLARDIYLACFPLYNIPLSKEILPDNFPKNEFLKVILENRDISKKIERVSPVLQLQLVNDVLSISSSDLALQTKIISIILHYFREDINTLTQQQLFSHLISLGNRLNKNLKLDLTYLPQVVKITPIVEIIKVNIKQHEPGSDKGSNIFIYNPWKKGNANITDYNWMVGEVCYVKVFLKNVFEFEIFVDMIQLVTEGVRTMTYPTSIIMKKTKKLQELTLKFKPLEKGTINILGVVSKLSNFMHFHPINPKGIALKNPSDQTKATGIKKIPIKERISTLKAYFEDLREEIPLYEGGYFHTRFLIENKSETTLCLRKLMISFAFGDNTTMDREIEVNGREIKKFESLSVIICRAVPEEETGIRELFEMHDHLIFNAFNVANIDKLFKIYVKLIYYESEKPNLSIEDNVAKEVKMMKSLRVYQAKVSDSIAAEDIVLSGKTYKQISVDNSFYLNLEIVRDDPEKNNRDYFVSVYKKGQQKPLVEKLMLGLWSNINMLVKTDRKTLEDQNGAKINPKEVFYAKWKDTNSLDNGYLFLNNVDTEAFEAKAEALKLGIDIETDFLDCENGRHQVKIGELNKIRARVRFSEKEKKKLYVSILLSERDQIEEVIRGGNEKGVLYKGKRNHLVEIGEGKEEVVIETGVILTNKAVDYKVFCFAVDDQNSIIYSFKYKNFIQSM